MSLLGDTLIFDVITIMNIRTIVLVYSLLYTSFSLNAQSSDSVIVRSSHRQVQKITYHPATYKNVAIRDNYISGFALGLDYSEETFVDKNSLAWDSSNTYLGASGGFNMYGMFMPKTFRNWRNANPTMGNINWGFGFNINQFHKSKPSSVIINTVNQDSGRTRLETSLVSFYTKARYEWGLGRFYPFVGIQAGFTLASTDQYTETFMVLTDYERTSQDNISTSAAGYWAPEIGARIRLNSWFSVVVAHEWKFGSQITLTDVKNTSFSGMSLSAPKHEVNYQTGMLKVGVLFDLSSNKYEKELVREAYYDTAMVMEEIRENKPCPPCPPCATETKTIPSKDSKKNDSGIRTNETTPQTIPNTNSTPQTIEIPKKKLPGIVVPTPTKKKS